MDSTTRFSRIERLIGAAGLLCLRQSFVTVVGLGAVGSFAVEGLARSGVGRLRLVDFDKVGPSNFNRQLYALESTLGQAKIAIARQRVLDINPDCQVETLGCFVHVDTLDQVLAGPPDLLIDAIDSMTPKLELLTAAAQRGIAVVSSMGAALRRDPGSVRVGPLEQTRHCPLARQIRQRLRQREMTGNIQCVYSVELMEQLPPEAVGDLNEADFDALRRGRVRRALGSLPTLTGIFGLTAANKAIEMLLAMKKE